MDKLYFYDVYYGSTLVEDSRSRGKVFGDFFETKEQAEQAALKCIENYIEWKKENGGWSDADDLSDFTAGIGKIYDGGEIEYF